MIWLLPCRQELLNVGDGGGSVMEKIVKMVWSFIAILMVVALVLLWPRSRSERSEPVKPAPVVHLKKPVSHLRVTPTNQVAISDEEARETTEHSLNAVGFSLEKSISVSVASKPASTGATVAVPVAEAAGQ